MSFASVDEISSEERERHKREVIARNCEHARAFVATLRRKEAASVIDPTSYPVIPNWTQSQWIAFWGAVIARYASRVVFLDDWQFSSGCVQEYLIARSLKIPTFDERGEQLSVVRALELLDGAIGESAAHGSPASMLERVAEELRNPGMHEWSDLGIGGIR
jgi:hypothetical protein